LESSRKESYLNVCHYSSLIQGIPHYLGNSQAYNAAIASHGEYKKRQEISPIWFAYTVIIISKAKQSQNADTVRFHCTRKDWYTCKNW